jgi:hypothetical protein
MLIEKASPADEVSERENASAIAGGRNDKHG